MVTFDLWFLIVIGLILLFLGVILGVTFMLRLSRLLAN